MRPQVLVGLHVWLQVAVVAACALEAYSGQEAGLNGYFIVAVLTVVVVALRHRAPSFLAFAAGPAMGYAGLALAPAVLLFSAGHREPRRLVLAALVAWTVLSSALLSPWPPAEWVSFDVAVRLAGGLLMRAVLIAGAVGLGQLLRVHQAQTAMVTELVAGRAREQALAEHAARADERAALAREMHDVVASQITVLAVQAGALRMVCGGDERVQEIAEAIRVAAARTTRELREVLLALRETSPDISGSAPGRQETSRATVRLSTEPSLGLATGSAAGSAAGSAVPLKAAALAQSPGRAMCAQVSLEGLEQLWRDSGCRGELVMHLPSEVAVSPAVQRAGYRIVQEGLTNAVRYAPGAQVRVGVEVVAATVVVSVINGPALVGGVVPTPSEGPEQLAMQPEQQPEQRSEEKSGQAEQAAFLGRAEALRGLSTGHGLRGVQERAEAVGGHASWGLLEGGGFQLVTVLPLSS